jgi:hypothetical protein
LAGLRERPRRETGFGTGFLAISIVRTNTQEELALSPLTKIFVVLLVLLSVVLTAGTVVFVYRADKAQTTISGLQLQNTATQSKLAQAEADSLAARAELAASRQNQQASVAAINQTLLATQQTLADRDVTVAELTSKNTIQEASLARLSEALKASEDTKTKLQEVVVAQRVVADDNTKRIAELNASVSDLTNRLEVTERERRFLSEQYSAAQSTTSQLSAAAKDAGLSVANLLETAGTRAGAPRINAVVRDVRTIAAVPYATISVGSADSVKPGMEFKIIDRARGDFLGILTVESVLLNEATGRLVGPRVPDIGPGSEARTQL